MINRVGKMRRPMLAAAGIALLAVVAGCSSGSTSADTSADDTATETTSSSAKEIGDPAVEQAALRTVDACGLLNETTLGSIGTIAPDSLSSSEWSVCSVDINDASGKTVELVLRVGEQITIVDDPTEELAGLPLIVDDDDPESCWVSAVTSYEPPLAITAQVDYAGGDACSAGRTALEKVIGVLHASPPQLQQLPGTSLTADPCAVADKKAVEDALGPKTFVEPKSPHACDTWTGDSTSYPLVSVEFYLGIAPEASEGEPVDLGGGVTGVQVKEDGDVVSCDVSWRHIQVPDEDHTEAYGEVASVELNGEPGELDPATACEQAVAIAKTVVPSLGQA